MQSKRNGNNISEGEMGVGEMSPETFKFNT